MVLLLALALKPEPARAAARCQRELREACATSGSLDTRRARDHVLLHLLTGSCADVDPYEPLKLDRYDTRHGHCWRPGSFIKFLGIAALTMYTQIAGIHGALVHPAGQGQGDYFGGGIA